MPTDLDIIAQLEKHIVRKLKKLDEIYYDSVGYQLNYQQRVIGLGLFQCALSELPAEIGQLENLRELSLIGNNLSELPAEIGQLENLQELNLNGNNLSELPAEIGQLEKLERLYLDRNKLSELPAEIGQLRNLQELNLNGNNLSEWPAEIVQLKNLQTLILSVNKLSELPAEIGQLENLWELSLIGNKLSELPAEVGQLQNSCQLSLNNNPLKTTPIEIAKKGIPAIRDYFQSLAKEENLPLNEAKVIILGQGGIGKTSLVNRLLYDTYNDTESKTEGINVEKWQVPIDNQQIRLNVWDFGGQEVMHATHQFFLTKRSLYILLIDARQGEEFSRPEYWLKLIQTYGGDSPVLVVVNKTDEHQLAFNKKFLQQKYKNIQGFYDISCKKNTGIDTLKTAITKQIKQLPHVFDILPKSWFDLKQQLEAMPDDFITYDHYVQVCTKHQINETSPQKTLIDLLHDLGIVLNFREDTKRPQLQNTNILKPNWATEAIYKLINCHVLFQTKGVLELPQLSELLDNTRYPQTQHRTLIELMTKFELCFEMPNTAEESYLIADLLNREEPDLNWNDKDCLKFEYHYDVLPSSIFSRFLVRMHKLISKKTYWFTGVMLTHENNKALIKTDLEDKKIFISVNGTTQTRRVLLGIIRNEFKTIHSTFAKLTIKEFVPYKGTNVSYQRLLRLEVKGKETDYLDEIDEDIDVQTLLNGLSDPQNRQREREERHMNEGNSRDIHIHSNNIQHVNLNTGDDVTQAITVDEESKKENDEPKPEWAGRWKLFLQILAVIAAFAIATAAWYKIF